ncbi:5-hydroxytryptamine receptor 1-like [Strongylocentrotus purpuratus]|uniref:G-protein coupled receptors family 1 profile domain-containing protein n=1 Tax=Strongylocentrotus purpuratus TaxID=7668 RepID=A0A7M7PIY6_STRPU|nr:5-hydroxytryptamine receptor 1-like [Strongylocentrotus purpuratus]
MEYTMYPTDITREIYPTHEATDHDLPGIADQVLQSLSLGLIMAGTLIFNTLTIFIILRVRSLRCIPHNLLILNLAIADLGVVLCSMVFSFVSIFDNGYFLSSHRKVCMVQGFLVITVSFTNLPTILSIAVDRLLILVLSRHFQPNRSRVLVMVAISWLVGATVATVATVSATIGHATYISYHPGTLHCSMMWRENESFRINTIILNYGFFVLSLLGCYVSITYHLWKEERRLKSHSLSRSKATDRVTMSTAVTEGATPKPDEGAQQDSGEGNESWIFSHSALATKDRVEFSETHSNHHLQDEQDGAHTTNVTTAKKNRLKIERRKHMAHKRVAKMAILLVLAVVTCWTPYMLYHSKLIGSHETARLGVFTMWMAYCNALIDPLIYAFVNRSVRAEMRRVVRNMRRIISSIGSKVP